MAVWFGVTRYGPHPRGIGKSTSPTRITSRVEEVVLAVDPVVSGCDHVGDRLADQGSHRWIEQGFPVVIVADEPQLDEHRWTIELQDGEVGAKVIRVALEACDWQESRKHLIRESLVRHVAVQDFDAVRSIIVKVINPSYSPHARDSLAGVA